MSLRTPMSARSKHMLLGCHEFGQPEGRPVVFLHGANQSGASWRDVAALLPDHRAICFDLPGTGLNRGQTFESMTHCADVVAESMRAQFPGQKLPIAGLSLGAYVGLLITLRHPQLIASTILSGFQVTPLKGHRALIVLGAVLSPMMTSYSFRKRAARAMGIPERSAAWPTVEAPCSAKVLRKINRSAATFDVSSDINGLQVPLLALAGDLEAKPIRDALAQIEARSDMAKGVLVPGGHAWPAVRPDLFARLLIGWIEDRTLPDDPDIRPF